MSKQPNEDEEIKTLSDALAFFAYHLGVFAFKVTLIVCIWFGVVYYLEKLMLK